MKNASSFICLCMLLFLCSCARIKSIEKNKSLCDRSRTINIFIDGTKNNPGSKTNVIKLHDLQKGNPASFYIEGVGTGSKILGMGIALGTAKRVQKSYLYLCRNYEPGDSIYLFGFSRGAYACRILSNIMYAAGVLDFKNVKKRQQKKIVKKVYYAYRDKDDDALTRTANIKCYIDSWNKKHVKKRATRQVVQLTGANVEAMGLWETVEAFGLPDYIECDFPAPNRRHLNQVCNIKRAFHAVALDDNRAKLYTPVLLATPNNASCQGKNVSIDSTVTEVWFAGAHSDVGGGYNKDPEIANVSLNWMLNRFKPYGLFRDTGIAACAFSPLHDAESMFVMWILAQRINRNITLYHNAIAPAYNNGKIKVHHSVIERLRAGEGPHFKLSEKQPRDWYDMPPFEDCFTKSGDKRLLKDGCTCIEVVYD